jgi:aspartate aminotransferase
MLVSLNADVMSGVLRVAQGRLSSGIIDQQVAAKLTEVPPEWMAKTHDEWSKRRDVLYNGLKDIPGVTIPKPEGAFYSIVGLPVEDSEDFAKWLLTDFRIIRKMVIGSRSGFYATKGMGKVKYV